MASSQMPAYKQDFLKAVLDGGVLNFGRFELKSKRVSPYFFNAGELHTARLAGAIATAFARAILDAGLDLDVIFGPAYKGIPLCSAVTIKLGGEGSWGGGSLVGASLRGKRVVIVDDVITAGTAKRDAIDKIRREGGEVVGIVVALDRMEKLPASDGDDSKPGPSAIGELRREYGVPIVPILTLRDIIDGSKGLVGVDDVKRMEEYRLKYQATD
ncbi:orotate phosphoribosyltransferase [Ophiocordyceps camponoti-floridani]|uniref:Orotate phosphoribosyltransferase n=1 Tax=Ophiocordyceps camponoti-floridani TaxID=2030778 RepID=A0A8H4Q661_9HYPO|nr:orotate phosphoribosyltransferase [Ophiocordyceps camponoti-floridani]